MVSGRWVGGSVVGGSVVLIKPDIFIFTETKLDNTFPVSSVLY